MKAKPIVVIRFFNVQFGVENVERMVKELEKKLSDYHVIIRCYGNSPALPEIEVLNPSDELKELDIQDILKYIENERLKISSSHP